MSIRELQQEALYKMLNLNQALKPFDAPSSSVLVWKVLIYDKFGQDVISPSLRLGDLRGAGITLHMGLSGARQPIPDAPAIYFVEPTSENIARVVEDLKRGLYESVYLNFTSPLSRSLLEDLAAQTVAANCSAPITQVYDQFLNYISLDSQLFSLEMPAGVFQRIHSPTTTERDIEKLVDDVTNSLFSVIVTLGTVPIIKCPKGNVAELVAKKLDSKLRDNILNSRTNLFTEKGAMARPVLVLLDRHLDISSMVTHSWTYSTLFHDMLDMKLNRVSFVTEERKQLVTKSYDIDITDNFWIKNAACPLPEVGLYIEKETKVYKEEVENVGGSTDDPDTSDVNLSTQALSSKIQALPELRRRKKVLDMHTAIATHLLNNIVKRQLDSFITMEQSIGKLNTMAILEIIKDEKKEAQDKLRLVLVFLLNMGGITKTEFSQIEKALADAGCSIQSLVYIKQLQIVSKMTASQQPQESSSSTDLLGSMFGSNLTKFTESVGGIGEGFGSFISGVRSQFSGPQELPLTKIVDAIMEGSQQGSGVEDYLTFDPKGPKPTSGSTPMSSKRSNFADAVAFVIGGGNYQEYHNLMEYAARSNLVKKSIVYGATELISPTKFVQELETLGSQHH